MVSAEADVSASVRRVYTFALPIAFFNTIPHCRSGSYTTRRRKRRRKVSFPLVGRLRKAADRSCWPERAHCSPLGEEDGVMLCWDRLCERSSVLSLRSRSLPARCAGLGLAIVDAQGERIHAQRSAAFATDRTHWVGLRRLYCWSGGVTGAVWHRADLGFGLRDRLGLLLGEPRSSASRACAGLPPRLPPLASFTAPCPSLAASATRRRSARLGCQPNMTAGLAPA